MSDRRSIYVASLVADPIGAGIASGGLLVILVLILAILGVGAT